MEKKHNTQGDERLEIYEVGFHIVPIVSVDTLPAEVNAIRSLIESNGGVIISEEAPKSRGLAYSLTRMRGGKREKFDNAHFGWIKYECPITSADAIKVGMDKNENILRYLIIKTVRESTLANISKFPVRNGKSPENGASGVLAEAVVGASAGAGVGAGASAETPSEVTAEKPKMSNEEIDKTIDDMVKE